MPLPGEPLWHADLERRLGRPGKVVAARARAGPGDEQDREQQSCGSRDSRDQGHMPLAPATARLSP